MKKKSIVSALMLGGLIGTSAIGAQSISASGQHGEVNYLSNQERVASIRALFSDSKPTDKVLQVDGGYLQGTMETVDDSGNIIKYNSETDSNSITVAEAMKIEIDMATSPETRLHEILSDKNLRFPNPPTKPKSLGRGETYKSGIFNGGAGWEFAGFKFMNQSGADTLTWWSYGDVGRAGDMRDAKNQFNNPYGTYGIQLNPGVPTRVYPTDGDFYTTYYSWQPAYGSYYQVQGI